MATYYDNGRPASCSATYHVAARRPITNHKSTHPYSAPLTPRREPKPSPYCLDYLMSKYDIPKEDVCYVGDAMNDMLAAQNAGIDGIYIPRGNPDDAPCAFRIESLRDLLV